MSTISENIRAIEARIQAACERCARSRSEVKLIGVSKTKPVEDIMQAYNCGLNVFGENRVQELTDKYDKINLPLEWHLIGHLQQNKVKYLPGKVSLIHSVDSRQLAYEINKQAQKHSLTMDILCEVNIAKEQTKFGFSAEVVQDFAEFVLKECPFVHLKGLMTVAPRTGNPETNRLYFRQLKQLLEEINSCLPLDKRMSELSMGMSGDFEVAIEEGATMVRVGSSIFGARDYGAE